MQARDETGNEGGGGRIDGGKFHQAGWRSRFLERKISLAKGQVVGRRSEEISNSKCEGPKNPRDLGHKKARKIGERMRLARRL
jgi:hypothetical protein